MHLKAIDGYIQAIRDKGHTKEADQLEQLRADYTAGKISWQELFKQVLAILLPLLPLLIP